MRVFVRPSGWDIPGLAGATRDTFPVRTDLRGSIPVTAVWYKPGKHPRFTAPAYAVDPDTQTIVIGGPGIILSAAEIHEYSVAGRVFEYEVNATAWGEVPDVATYVDQPQPRQKRRKGIPAGALGCDFTHLFYVDEDGDGKFETLYIRFGGGVALPRDWTQEQRDKAVADYGFPRTHVPAWAAALAK
jgi:hypothetical protein